MAHKTDDLCSTGSTPLQDSWIGTIACWFRAKRDKYEKNQDIIQMLSRDERLLKDIGFSREQLVAELGYDPRQLPELFSGGQYRTPHW
ncbi:MAG: hypothetical protein ABJM26_00950 [Anderseniella sp.]